MKKIAVKVITIFSQLLVVTLFVFSLFKDASFEEKSLIVNNNNFNKMAKMTTILFEEEDKNVKNIDESVVSLFEEEKEELVKEEEIHEEIPTIEEPTTNPVPLETDVLDTFVGPLTGYGADCVGCSGITSSGFDLTKSIYYEDAEYGSIRIVAADPSFPMYSIFRISNVPGMDTFIAIVLDRGSGVGFGRSTLFDLAYFSESDTNLIGKIPNVTFELLRRGK